MIIHFQVIDYGPVLYVDRVTGIIQRQDQANPVNLWVYVQIFRADSWTLILLMSILIALLFGVMNRFRSRGLTDNVNGCQVLFLLILQLGIPYELTTLPTRSLMISTCIFGFLIFAHYTADLTTTMTVRQEIKLFKNIMEIVASDYKLRTMKNAAPVLDLQEAKIGALKVLFETKVTSDSEAQHELEVQEMKAILQVSS